MHSYLRNRFHLPRKPLVRKTAKCVYFAFAGVLLIALIPKAEFKVAGIIPIIWSWAYWHYLLLPKWGYSVVVGSNSLEIGSKRYLWTELQSLKIEHQGSRQFLQLIFLHKSQRRMVLLQNDIADFDDLARQCFWYANDFPSFNHQSSTGDLSSTAKTKTEG